MKWNPLAVALPMALALTLLVAPPAAADSSVSIEEWHYLQRINVISKVNEAIWNAFEDDGGWNSGLAQYAKDTTTLNVRTLRKAAPPARELFAFHNALVGVMSDMELFYAAIAHRNFGRAHELGARIERSMLAVEASWAKVKHRYDTPANR